MEDNKANLNEDNKTQASVEEVEVNDSVVEGDAEKASEVLKESIKEDKVKGEEIEAAEESDPGEQTNEESSETTGEESEEETDKSEDQENDEINVDEAPAISEENPLIKEEDSSSEGDDLSEDDSEKAEQVEKKSKKLSKKTALISLAGLGVVAGLAGGGALIYSEIKASEIEHQLNLAFVGNPMFDIEFGSVSASIISNDFSINDVVVREGVGLKIKNLFDGGALNAFDKVFESTLNSEKKVLFQADSVNIDNLELGDLNLPNAIEINIEEATIFPDSFSGNSDLTKALQGVVSETGEMAFHGSYKHTLTNNTWVGEIVMDLDGAASVQVDGDLFEFNVLDVQKAANSPISNLYNNLNGSTRFNYFQVTYKDHGLMDSYVGVIADKMDMEKDKLYGRLNKVNGLYKRDMESLGSDLGVSFSKSLGDMLNVRSDIISILVEKGNKSSLSDFFYQFNTGSLFENNGAGYKVEVITN